MNELKHLHSKKLVVFVCTGNVCRSPMAEALFRYKAKDQPFEVTSAGIAAWEGSSASLNAILAMDEIGIDISSHKSKPITAELIRQADFIICMAHHHLSTIISQFPEATEKTFLISEFTSNPELQDKDIPDPIGGSIEEYKKCRDLILSCIDPLIQFLKSTFVPSDNTQQEDNPMEKIHSKYTVVIGADHAGYTLKQAIIPKLQQKGWATIDVGTYTPESCDYPDYAKSACEKVISGEADFGILICSTGIGMSIAANKIEGIRAALVCDIEEARLAHSHNNANVICLGARRISVELALQIIDVFAQTKFEGGRHERRIKKLESLKVNSKLAIVDPEIYKAIEAEKKRQQENLELIASENFTSLAVMEAQGSVLTNKYAEGYPKKRWYGGCEFVDIAEELAIERAKQLFGAEHANVQPHSGSQANMAVYFAVLNPGDKILSMDLSHGGHLTHGHPANFSGRFFQIIPYGVSRETEQIDYDQLAELARQHRPKMITVGASAYPRIIDFERISQIAQEVGAYLLADIAHIAGLIVAGLHPNPVPYADFVTTTTHKTLRGPRGGLILCKAKYAKQIDSTVFPGVQGGPLMHVIAAKAVCFHEAMRPEFKEYQKQIVKNAKALAGRLLKHGYRLVSGGTDTHLILVDVGVKGWSGKQCQEALDRAGITVNKNTIPFETRSPFQASGIRIGTPAVTTRGMKEPQMELIADLIHEVLSHMENLDVAQKVREIVRELTRQFPLPY